MLSGSEFHNLAAMTRKARSVAKCGVCVAGTTRAAVGAEHSLGLGRRSDTSVTGQVAWTKTMETE